VRRDHSMDLHAKERKNDLGQRCATCHARHGLAMTLSGCKKVPQHHASARLRDHPSARFY
jgi:hypothetical protein